MNAFVPSVGEAVCSGLFHTIL